MYSIYLGKSEGIHLSYREAGLRKDLNSLFSSSPVKTNEIEESISNAKNAIATSGAAFFLGLQSSLPMQFVRSLSREEWNSSIALLDSYAY